MVDHQFGSTCPKCVRLADAERMRANDEKPRTGRPEGGWKALAGHVALAVSLDADADATGYPRALATVSGDLERTLLKWDMGGLAAPADAARILEDFVWHIRTMAAELSRAGKAIHDAREARDAAEAANHWAVTTKGGEV